jgi:hypothetical protein
MESEIGFHFHTAMKYEADAHQDCVCALAKLIGHTDASFQNYEFKKILWKMVRFVPIGDENFSDKVGRDRGGVTGWFDNDKQHRSFGDQSVKSEQALKLVQLENHEHHSEQESVQSNYTIR